MKLKSGINYVFETKADGSIVFKSDAGTQVLNVSTIKAAGYEVIFEKNNKIYGRKTVNGSTTDTEIDVSNFLVA